MQGYDYEKAIQAADLWKSSLTHDANDSNDAKIEVRSQ
jgi:hypothetical protein